jgi:hypothetical protein
VSSRLEIHRDVRTCPINGDQLKRFDETSCVNDGLRKMTSMHVMNPTRAHVLRKTQGKV